jgi:hypothetical protein
VIVNHEGRDYALGRRLDVPHDPRNRDYPAARATGLRKAVRWARRGAPLDQGQLGSCTGNALAGWLNTAPGAGALPVRTETDAIQYYSWGTRCDRIFGVYPPTDTGCTGPAVAKGARDHGVLKSWTHAFGLDHLLDALQVGPAMVGTVWLYGMFQPDPSGLVVPSGKVAGGHEYLADEYVPDAGLVGFQQSWGQWGVGGRFYIRQADVGALLRDGGDVTVPVL